MIPLSHRGVLLAATGLLCGCTGWRSSYPSEELRRLSMSVVSAFASSAPAWTERSFNSLPPHGGSDCARRALGLPPALLPGWSEYVLSVVSTGRGASARFTARAIGDLDCDGRLSTFERVGWVSPDGVVELGAGEWGHHEGE